MSALSTIDPTDTLPTLIERATRTLDNARTSAEILEASEGAALVYDIAKRTARLAKAKTAHDSVVSAAHRAQADALLIEARAKVRLADEYDAAQERGEVRRAGNPNCSEAEQLPGTEDLGLSRKQIHEARQVRDAEKAEPGIIKRTLDQKLEANEEPTRAAMREAVIEAARVGIRGGDPFRQRQPAKNPLYRPPTAADAAWSHLYGDCRALAEWATDENVALAMRGCAEADYDQKRNIEAIRDAKDALTRVLELIDAH
jgi:hypothetical protein